MMEGVCGRVLGLAYGIYDMIVYEEVLYRFILVDNGGFDVGSIFVFIVWVVGVESG